MSMTDGMLGFNDGRGTWTWSRWGFFLSFPLSSLFISLHIDGVFLMSLTTTTYPRGGSFTLFFFLLG
jgi:hypothetical protein